MRRLILPCLLLLATPAQADFVNNNTSLPTTKSDLTPIPPGADPTKYFRASDYNAMAGAAYDLRHAIVAGAYHGFTPEGVNPNPVNSSNYLWLSSTKQFHFGVYDTGSAMVVDNQVAYGPVASKGDILVYDGTVFERLTVGSNGKSLVADSTQPSGIKWDTVSGSGGYDTIQSGGSSLVQRTALHFDGTSITCVDNGGATRTDCVVTPSGVSVGGDVSGNVASETVVALQGRTVVSTAPTTGQVLEWGGSNWAPTTIPVVNNSVAGEVSALSGTLSAVYVDGGAGSASWRKLTSDDLGPAFAITSFSKSVGSTFEIGDTISSPVNFTASYASAASSATIDDGINSTVTLITPFTSGTESHSYTKSVPNQGVTWTLTAHAATTKTATVSATWYGRVYYGIQTPGTINSAFVTGLPSSQLQGGFSATYSIGAGGNTKKAYLFFDDAFGTPSVFKDAGTGFAVPMTCTATAVSVTNSFSVTRSLTECVSDNFLNASFNLQVQ